MVLLVADDEPEIRFLVQLRAGLVAQVEVLEAADGRQALATLRERAVDLLVTDLNMPHLDGAALRDVVREQYPSTRVILWSASRDPRIGGAPVPDVLNKDPLQLDLAGLLADTTGPGGDA